MSRVRKEIVSTGSEPLTPAGTVPDEIRERVEAYCRGMGLTAPDLVARLADECLEQAAKLSGGSTEDEVLRRALEQVQRRFDHALARAAHLPQPRNSHTVAAARAAALLALPALPKDSLLESGENSATLGEAIRRAMPRSTPPESPLPMHEAPLRFWLFKSPPH